MNIKLYIRKLYRVVIRIISCFKYNFKHVNKSAHVPVSVKIYNRNNIYMEAGAALSSNSTIMNTRAKFVMKKNSGAAYGLSVVTGAHMSVVGMAFRDVTDTIKDKYDIHHSFDKDVVIEEDVWIASNVTLLSGVTVGRGAVVGAGAVVRTNVPPYSIVIGNPAKVIGFRFSPDEVVEHENTLYDENDRIEQATLEKNYQKYFIDRLVDIRNFTKI